jgi:hypothetical protein
MEIKMDNCCVLSSVSDPRLCGGGTVEVIKSRREEMEQPKG